MTGAVLAGDIGGTKTVLALARVASGGVSLITHQRFENDAYPDFNAVLADFLRGADVTPAAACLGIAGPVTHHHRGQLTNRAWAFDAETLARRHGIGTVVLVNDLEAFALGLDALAPTERVTLQAGEPDPTAPRAVMAAGTGLGECILLPAGDGYRLLPTEAGHTDFAPADGEQLALLNAHWTRTQPVSVERFLSGPGLMRLYEFHRADELEPPFPGTPEEVVHRAQAGTDPAARLAVDLFIRIYGAQAGNLALTCLPFGGLFLGGGIAATLAEWMPARGFLDQFRHKARMDGLLDRIPIHVVLRTDTPVLGAALTAAYPHRLRH